MIRNFVDDSYLEQFYPQLVNFRQGSQQDFSGPIDTAFHLVLNDLSNRGVDPRLCMVPIDLNRSRTASQNIQQLTSTTLAATTNGTHWEGGKQRRFVVNPTKSVEADDWSFILQGSNLNTEPEEGDASWETISTIQYDTNTASAEDNTTFSAMYKWYRVRVVKNSGSGTVTFTAGLYETTFDNLIAYKTLGMLARSWDTGINDRWVNMALQMESAYDNELNTVKISYDANEDGITSASESGSRSGGLFGSIGISA